MAIVSANLQDGPLTGIRLLPEIRRINSETRTLVALESPEPDLVIEAFRFGADGVFCRNSPFDLLCKSVEAVSQGQIWASNDELRYVLNAFAKSSKQRKMDSNVESRMTKREAEVVRLAVEGLSNREIGQQLGLTEHTVKNYLFRVFDKLGSFKPRGTGAFLPAAGSRCTRRGGRGAEELGPAPMRIRSRLQYVQQHNFQTGMN